MKKNDFEMLLEDDDLSAVAGGIRKVTDIPKYVVDATKLEVGKLFLDKNKIVYDSLGVKAAHCYCVTKVDRENYRVYFTDCSVRLYDDYFVSHKSSTTGSLDISYFLSVLPNSLDMHYERVA